MLVRSLAAFACAVAACTGVLPGAGAAFAQSTLDKVKARGQLSCGVNTGLTGFSARDDKGNWIGLDADYCRAIAAAVLGDATKVTFVPTTTKERFTALNSGEIDVLARDTTWTLHRDSAQGLVFAGVNYYDGQGFIVKKAAGISAARQLDGATVCVQTGTTTELNLADFFRDNRLAYKILLFEKPNDAVQAYQDGRCDSYTSDVASLYAQRLALARPDDHVVLPDVISKEPLGPAVQQGDSRWFTIVRWVHFALLLAEEAGVSQSTLESSFASSNADVKRLLGRDGDFGAGLGLDKDWVVRIVRQVGNYGEIYERHLGDGSRLKIARGLNRLWRDGGLHYAPPIR